MGIREERRLERQAAVLNSASELIKTSGVEGVTMAAIATHMSASIGGLYRYYPNKEAIFIALQIKAIDAFDDCLSDLIPQFSESDSRFEVLERVVTAFEAWTHFQSSAPSQFHLLDQFLSSPKRTLDDEGRKLVNERLIPVLTKLSNVLQEAAVAGVLSPGDAMTRTHILWAAVHGMEHFRKRDSEQEVSMTVDILRPQMIATILIGWGASKGLVTAVLALG